MSVSERPDVAIVIVQDNTQASLKMIQSVVREAACPVIALLDVQDRAFINQAAAQGVFACITGEENSRTHRSADATVDATESMSTARFPARS